MTAFFSAFSKALEARLLRAAFSLGPAAMHSTLCNAWLYREVERERER